MDKKNASRIYIILIILNCRKIKHTNNITNKRKYIRKGYIASFNTQFQLLCPNT